MDEIVKMVSEKFNIAPETAQQIVAFIAEQVKGKLPEGLASHMDSLMAGGAGAAGSEGLLDTVKNMASSILNKA
jgi:hypothetical protein